MSRTTGKELYKWLAQQKNVRWPSFGGGLIVYLDYKDVRCVGNITKTYRNGVLAKTKIKITPILAKDSITEKAGEHIEIEFEKKATK